MKKNLSLTSLEPFIRFEIREGVAVFRLTDDIIDTPTVRGNPRLPYGKESQLPGQQVKGDASALPEISDFGPPQASRHVNTVSEKQGAPPRVRAAARKGAIRYNDTPSPSLTAKISTMSKLPCVPLSALSALSGGLCTKK